MSNTNPPPPSYAQTPVAERQQGQQNYGVPPVGYGQPQMGYGQPQMGYGQPQMGYGQPQMGYGQPQMGYGQPPPQGVPQVQWMERPTVSGCPPGLEYLSQVDQLLIKQKIEMAEMFTGFEMNNRYIVYNSVGQSVYYAKEETDCCTRQCCGPQRPFVIHISDNMNQEVITITRPFRCLCGGQCFSCLECCQDEVQVESPPGNVIGYVKQLYEGCNVRYSILNEQREQMLRLHGPSYFYCYCPGDDYPVQLIGSDGVTPVGRVSKQWSNLFQEFFTDSDNFGIQFPMDLDVKMKAVVLGGVFLIDFMFFEQKQKNNH